MDDKFIVEDTSLEGVKILTPQRFRDDRGHLTVIYNKKVLQEALGVEFVQAKSTKSSKGVLRGIHFQEQHAQGKLVSVLCGRGLDVVVDLRKNSATFGEYYSILLDSEKEQLIYMPPGMGHAFLSLEDNTVFLYNTTDYFYPEYDKGISWDDKDLNINWQMDLLGIDQPTVSKRDKILPGFKEYFKI